MAARTSLEQLILLRYTSTKKFQRKYIIQRGYIQVLYFDVHVDKFVFSRTGGSLKCLISNIPSTKIVHVCLVWNGFPVILYVDGKIILWVPCKLWERIRFRHILLCMLLLLLICMSVCKRCWGRVRPVLHRIDNGLEYNQAWFIAWSRFATCKIYRWQRDIRRRFSVET